MVLIISFIGVALLITGAVSGSTEITDAPVIVPDVTTAEPSSVSVVDQTTSAVQSASLIIPIIAMLGLPVMGAAQSILLRQLRSMSEYTVSSYTSFSMALIYGLLMLAPGQNLQTVTENF